jgi:hypothetical protein
LCGLALTVGEACSTIATAVRISLLDWSPRPATGGHYGCFRVTAGFPSGIGSILTTLVLRPHENRKTLHAQRIQRAAADLSAGCPRPSVVSQMCLPQDRRSATGLSNRPGCVPSPHPDSCPRRSSCITAPYPYPKAKGARWFTRDQSPEATPVLWRYTSTKVAYYDTGPPKSRRTSGPRQRAERRVQKQRSKLKPDRNRFARAVQRFAALTGGNWRAQ